MGVAEDIAAEIEAICDYAAVHGQLAWEDRIWAYNSVLSAIGHTGPGPQAAWALAENAEDPAVSPAASSDVPDKLLADLAEHAIAAS